MPLSPIKLFYIISVLGNPVHLIFYETYRIHPRPVDGDECGAVGGDAIPPDLNSLDAPPCGRGALLLLLSLDFLIKP